MAMQLGRGLVAGVFALMAICITGCGNADLPKGTGWQVVGGLEDIEIKFVQIDQGSAKDGAVYRDAVSKLCASGRCVQIGFFLPGDRTPPSTSKVVFFSNGGWREYQPAAIYNRTEFTRWDCARAGVEGAPLSALCGEGVREEYSAVLALAARDGWVKGCGLPAVDGRKVVDRFVADLSTDRRRQLVEDYEKHLRSSERGPDSRSDCQKLRNRIETEARDARRMLRPRGAVN
jgi:hypothetical protein